MKYLVNKTHINSLAETDGFEFECFTRDKLINKEKIKTKDFNKEQRVNYLWRKVADKEELQLLNIIQLWVILKL